MRQNKEPDIQLPESLWITSVSSLDSHYSRGCDFSPLLFLHFVTKRRDICLSFIDEIQPFRLGRKHDSDINKKKKRELSAGLLTTCSSQREFVWLKVCHLWLLVTTRLSGCPLGSSPSLVFSLSWRALRLLSRAASSSSSSILAILEKAT